jgi:hypothetical protein
MNRRRFMIVHLLARKSCECLVTNWDDATEQEWIDDHWQLRKTGQPCLIFRNRRSCYTLHSLSWIEPSKRNFGMSVVNESVFRRKTLTAGLVPVTITTRKTALKFVCDTIRSGFSTWRIDVSTTRNWITSPILVLRTIDEIKGQTCVGDGSNPRANKPIPSRFKTDEKNVHMKDQIVITKLHVNLREIALECFAAFPISSIIVRQHRRKRLISSSSHRTNENKPQVPQMAFAS